MNTRFTHTAGAIITTAVLGTLLSASMPAYAQEAEFCDPIETVAPTKSPRKVIKAKGSRKAAVKHMTARKAVALAKKNVGNKKPIKLARAKPAKPLSFADRLRFRAKRMMMAALGPKKSKMCRPRVADQLGLLDKLVPAAGGTTPFKFTPDTSIGPLGSIFGGTARVINPMRMSATRLPGGGSGFVGGGGGGNSQPAAVVAARPTGGSGGGATTPGGGTTNPGGGTTAPGGDTTKPDGGSKTSPGDGSIKPGDGSTKPGDGGTKPGDGGTKPRDGGTKPGDGGNPGGGRCDPILPGSGTGIPGGGMNPLPANCGTNPGGGSTSSSGGTQVPEPGALSLLGLGVVMAAWRRRRIG